MNKILQKLIRPHYAAMSGYVSAGMESGKNETLVFMNANENHFVLPELEGYSFYPEPQPPKLLDLMGQAYGVKPSQLIAARGADEALGLLTKAFCEPHEDAIVIHGPTFGMYAVNADAAPVKIIDVPLIKTDDNFALDVDGMIAAALDESNKVKMLYLCSPNNPTGTSFPKKDILKIIDAVKNQCLVVLDEAYAECSEAGSLVSELENYHHLVILRTLSKAYSLAGIRVGACLCHDEDFIEFMRAKIIDIYPLPRPSIEAAMIALAPENAEKIQENIQKSLKERDRLKEYFENAPFVSKVYPSDANFLLVEIVPEIGASKICKYCADHGFILRDFSSKAETKNCLRIAPALPDQNTKLMDILDKY
jgi:histidinol-phosphate aminotransferase